MRPHTPFFGDTKDRWIGVYGLTFTSNVVTSLQRNG